MNTKQSLLEAYVALEQVKDAPEHEAERHLDMLQAIRERADGVIRELSRKRAGRNTPWPDRMLA